MTALAPPAVGRRPTTASTGGRSGSVAWMALPALVMFIAFGVIPLLGVLLLSFTSWDGIGADIQPAGLDSWRAVLTDPGLPHALWVTFLVMALSWAVQTPMSLLIGVFLAGHQRYRELLAVLYFIPLLLSSAAIAITYKALLDPNFGLGAGLGIPLLTQDWLGRAGPRPGRRHLRGVLAVHPVPLADLPGRRAADPAVDVRGRRRSTAPAGSGSSSASRCRSSSTRSSPRRR